MTWTDKVGDLLKQYTSSGGAAAAAQPAPDISEVTGRQRIICFHGETEWCPKLPFEAAVGPGLEHCSEIPLLPRRLTTSPAIRLEENHGKEDPGG